VKTAISIPDETFEQAERCAKALGVSRSEFYATAVAKYLEVAGTQSLAQRIDEAVELIGADDSAGAAVHAGRAVLADGDDW
jgi:metal-responsive CopG/Arc/MetJ family transcriptional regulator